MTLFDSPLPRHRDVPLGEYAGRARVSDPETSADAARTISGRTERLILDAMGSTDWTADGLCAVLPTVYPPTLKSALSRLANHKLIEPTGETRLSDRGCAQTVYRIT